MTELVAWLRAELDDDERVALAAVRGNSPDEKWRADLTRGGLIYTGLGTTVGGTSRDQAEHIVRWDPARVLAEVDAKRRIIKTYENAAAAHRAESISARNRTQDEAAEDVLGHVVRLLALPYAERLGYREEWRP